MTTLSIRKLVQGVPSFPYQKALDAALPGWEVSLVFVGKARATTLNKALRKKTYAPNVLSYETGKKSGEIIICPQVAKTQHKDYEMSYRDFVGYLFIHGCLHLKGQVHGTTMEQRERALLARVTRS